MERRRTSNRLQSRPVNYSNKSFVWATITESKRGEDKKRAGVTIHESACTSSEYEAGRIVCYSVRVGRQSLSVCEGGCTGALRST